MCHNSTEWLSQALNERTTTADTCDRLVANRPQHVLQWLELFCIQIEELNFSCHGSKRLCRADFRRVVDRREPLLKLSPRSLYVEDDPKHIVKRRAEALGRETDRRGRFGLSIDGQQSLERAGKRTQ